MEIVIREAADTDLEALIQCHNRFMEHHINRDQRFTLRPGASGKWKEQIYEAIKDAGTLVLVAEDNFEIAGCAYTIIKSGALDYGPERIGYICDVYVEPGYRRRGLARRFLEISEEWLKTKGITMIEASWAVNSIEALNTWPSLGFRPISVSGLKEI